MDFPLDDGVRAALLDSIEHDDCGYANGAGVGGRRSPRSSRNGYSWTLDPRGVFVIPDVLVGISEILRTLTQPGDRIVVNSPVYPPFYRVVGEVERHDRRRAAAARRGRLVESRPGRPRARVRRRRARRICCARRTTRSAWCST